MSALTCEEFKILFQLYNLKYMCSTYDIVCQNYCLEHNDCYCYCSDNQIYCVNHYYYAWRLLSVLLTAIFVSCCCYGCIMFFTGRQTNKDTNVYTHQENSPEMFTLPPYNNTEQQKQQNKKI